MMYPTDRRLTSKNTTFLLATAAAISFLHAGCGGQGTGKKAIGVPLVEVHTAASRQMIRSLHLTGTVEAAKVARIASPAQGPVQDCAVREGDEVEKGEVLLTIGRREAAEDRVAAAREELAREEGDLKTVMKLVESEAIPGEKLDESRLRVATARARLSEALLDVEDYRVRAPWAGEVSTVYVSDGYFASPREDLVEMFDPGSLVIRFAVPERDAVKVEVGTEIKASLDAYPGRDFTARIVRLYPELDRKTRTRTVEAVFEKEIDIAPGMFVRLIVPVETVEEAVVVPEEALVVTPQQEKIVFVIENGKASRRIVATGIEQAMEIQITEGISPGDSVIVAGNRAVSDGTRVRVMGGVKRSDR